MANNAKSIVVHVVSQSSLGTPALPTIGTTSALRVYQRPTPTIVGEGLIERGDVVSPYGPALRPIAGSRAWECTLMTELLTPDDQTDHTTSPLAPLWNSCGIVAEDPITWQPSRQAARGTAIGALVPFTLTIDEVGGNRYTLFDCHAIPTITVEAGQRGMISWSVRGRYVAPAASAITFADVVYSNDPLPVVGIGVSSSSNANEFQTVQRLEFVTGLAFVDRPDVRDAFGQSAVFLDWAEAPTVAFAADSRDETSQDVWTEVFGATAKDLTFTFTNGARCETVISMPVSYLRVPTIGGDAFATYDIQAIGTPNASNQSLLVTWNDA